MVPEPHKGLVKGACRRGKKSIQLAHLPRPRTYQAARGQAVLSSMHSSAFSAAGCAFLPAYTHRQEFQVAKETSSLPSHSSLSCASDIVIYVMHAFLTSSSKLMQEQDRMHNAGCLRSAHLAHGIKLDLNLHAPLVWQGFVCSSASFSCAR